jgi:oligopeptide/dipeptide ABC transporter ATP-binding protein
MTPLLDIESLTLRLSVEGRQQTVLHDVSLQIAPREVVGLVGESGSGKSMTARSIMRLLPAHAELGGAVRFDGRDVVGMTQQELRAFRTRDVAMVFQDPRAHINPVRRIGDFLTEALSSNLGVPRKDALARGARILREVGIADPERCLNQYPHELSGGMLQRVMIAAALLSEPALLLADEPTTALDVTTQSEVMALLQDISRERELAMLFITHDLELANAVCDRIGVMYAGQIVEDRRASDLRDEPLHPYTKALIASRPSIERRVERMPQISGRPLSAFEAPPGCPFQTRCPHVVDACRQDRPALRPLADGHVRCIRAEELRAEPAVEAPSKGAAAAKLAGGGQ